MEKKKSQTLEDKSIEIIQTEGKKYSRKKGVGRVIATNVTTSERAFREGLVERVTLNQQSEDAVRSQVGK